MIKKFTFVVVIVSAIMAILLLSPIALGWFHDATISSADVTGSIIGSYFEYGDGTEAKPFGIAQPKQLYYLAWLQDMGYFNKVENGQVKQFYFELSNKYGDTIDFKSLDVTYIIPPIGNTTYPFVGSFDGKGVTLKNLTIDNKYADLFDQPTDNHSDGYTEVEDGVQIVGLFGVVGAIGQDTTGATATVNNGTYSTAVNQINNFQVENITIKSTEPKDGYTLIGIVAGYVNGTISEVGVSNSTIQVGNNITHLSSIEGSNEVVSDFGLVGYCEDAYKETINITSLSATVPFETQNIIFKNSAEEGAGWGGSIDMKTLHTRLQNTLSLARNASDRVTTYVSREAVYVNNPNGEDGAVTLQTSALGSANDSDTGTRAYFYYYQSELGGSFMWADNQNTNNKYDEFHGVSATYWPKKVVTYTYETTPVNGFIITDGNGNFLKATNNGVSNTTNENEATVFVRESNGYLNFNYDDSSSDTTRVYYYLNTNTTNDNNGFTIGTSGSRNWTLDNGKLKTTISNVEYGIYFYNDTWSVRTKEYVIKDGDYYLVATTTGTSSTTNINDASRWYFTAVDNSSGYLYTYINNTIYYLRHNGSALSVSNSNTNQTNTYTYQWTWNTTNNALTTTYNSLTYDLEYNGSNWAVVRSVYYIFKDGSNYLGISGGSIINTTSQTNAARWRFSDGDNGGIISTVVNGTTYYLINNNNVLDLNTTNQTNWTYSNNCIYDGSYYIDYDSGWKLIQTTSFYIQKNGHYFYISGTGSTSYGNTDSINNASVWMLSGGKLSALYGSTRYYVYYTNNTNGMSITNNSTTATGTWSFDSSTGLMTHAYSGTTRYLVLNETTANNGTTTRTWQLKTLTDLNISGYRIYDTSASVYLNADGTSLSYGTSAPDATLWSNTGSYYYITYNNQTYYLFCTTRPQTPTLSTQTNRRMTYSDSSFYYVGGGGTYYLKYNSGSWEIGTGSGDSFTITTVSTINPKYTIECSPAISSNTSPTITETFLKSITRTDRGLGNSTTTSKERYNYTKSVETVAGGYDTYFPLAADTTAPFNVTSLNNTGYIVGGSHATYQSAWGDVRVSSNYTISRSSDSALYNSLYNQSSYQGKYLEVLTQTYLTGGGLMRISDAYNANNTTISSTMSAYTKKDATELGLAKYGLSRDQLEETYAGKGSTLYGMHFMDASINMSNLITAPVVYINDERYENYQMPEDSINFRLKSKGFINFFAGTYYLNTGKENNSFFSLYEIERNAANEITAIKHIKKIYGDFENNTKNYVYEYDTDTTQTLAAKLAEKGYTTNDLVFDTTWIEHPTIVQRALYYYEIPTNAGEYALGSVSETGRYGAYLIYLDISANGARVEDKDRIDTAELFEYYKYSCEIPSGVQLTQSGKKYDNDNPYETVVVEYQDGFASSDTLGIDNTNTFTYSNASHTSVQFVGGAINSQVSGSVYYPNGKYKKLVETIIDRGRESNATDMMKIETLDEYDSSGQNFVKRTVTVYAGVDVLASPDDATENNPWLKIIEFSYTLANVADYDTIVMRFIRASTIGGFNLCFDKDITVVNTEVPSELIHVNFGTAIGQTTLSATKNTHLTNQLITRIDLSKGTTANPNLNYYEKPILGEKLVNLYYYSETDISETTTVTVDNHFAASINEQTVNYTINITPATGETVLAYAYLENVTTVEKNTFIDTYVAGSGNDGSIISVPVTVTVGTIKVNDTTLTTEKQKITITSSGS